MGISHSLAQVLISAEDRGGIQPRLLNVRLGKTTTSSENTPTSSLANGIYSNGRGALQHDHWPHRATEH